MHRETWVDTAKGVAILLVVLGHAIRGASEAGIALGEFWYEIDERIYAFHMPLFFALSGWFYTHSIAGKRFSAFAVSRLERILYPMLIWTYVFFAAKLLAGEHANTPIGLGDIPVIPIPGVLHFWFLWDLLVLSFVAYPLRFALRESGIPNTVTLLAVFVVCLLQFFPLPPAAAPWFGSAIQNAPFFFLGLVLGQMNDVGRLGQSRLIVLAGLFVVVMIFWSFFAEIGYRSVGSFILVVCALGLLFGLEPNYPRWLRSYLALLGVASMSIYVMHTMFSAALREGLLSIGAASPLLHVLCGTVVGVLGPIALLNVARRRGIARLLGLEVAQVPHWK